MDSLRVFVCCDIAFGVKISGCGGAYARVNAGTTFHFRYSDDSVRACNGLACRICNGRAPLEGDAQQGGTSDETLVRDYADLEVTAAAGVSC